MWAFKVSSGKRFVKLAEGFEGFYFTNIGRSPTGMFWKASTEAYLWYYSHCPTLVFCRLEKIFYNLFLHESWVKFISNQFKWTLTLYEVHSCFLLKINIFTSHSNQSSSLPLELIDQFLYKGTIGLMRVTSKVPATSKIEIFVTIVKEWKLSKIVTNSSILDVTVVLDPVWVVW